MSKITESTLIPVSFVLVIIYGSMRFSNLEARVEASEGRIDRIANFTKEISQDVKSILQEVGIIKGMLKKDR